MTQVKWQQGENSLITVSRLMDQAFSEKAVEECGEFKFPGEGIKTVYLQKDGSGYFVLEIDEAAESCTWVDVSERVIAAMDAPEPRSPQLDHNDSAAFAKEVLGESY